MLKSTLVLFTTHSRPLRAMLAFAVFGCLSGGLAIAQVTHANGLTVSTYKTRGAPRIL